MRFLALAFFIASAVAAIVPSKASEQPGADVEPRQCGAVCSAPTVINGVSLQIVNMKSIQDYGLTIHRSARWTEATASANTEARTGTLVPAIATRTTL